MIRVVLESPYAGDIEHNSSYARACMHDCLKRGEAPFASHLLYTQDGVLDDEVIQELQLGIAAGLVWGEAAEKTLVYEDYGITGGMKLGIQRAEKARRPIGYRKMSHRAVPVRAEDGRHHVPP